MADDPAAASSSPPTVRAVAAAESDAEPAGVPLLEPVPGETPYEWFHSHHATRGRCGEKELELILAAAGPVIYHGLGMCTVKPPGKVLAHWQRGNMFGMSGSAVARACDLKKTVGRVGILFRAREVTIHMAGAGILGFPSPNEPTYSAAELAVSTEKREELYSLMQGGESAFADVMVLHALCNENPAVDAEVSAVLAAPGLPASVKRLFASMRRVDEKGGESKTKVVNPEWPADESVEVVPRSGVRGKGTRIARSRGEGHSPTPLATAAPSFFRAGAGAGGGGGAAPFPPPPPPPPPPSLAPSPVPDSASVNKQGVTASDLKSEMQAKITEFRESHALRANKTGSSKQQTARSNFKVSSLRHDHSCEAPRLQELAWARSTGCDALIDREIAEGRTLFSAWIVGALGYVAASNPKMQVFVDSRYEGRIAASTVPDAKVSFFSAAEVTRILSHVAQETQDMSEVVFSASVERIAAVVLKAGGASPSDLETFDTLVAELGVPGIVLPPTGTGM